MKLSFQSVLITIASSQSANKNTKSHVKRKFVLLLVNVNDTHATFIGVCVYVSVASACTGSLFFLSFSNLAISGGLPVSEQYSHFSG